MTHWTEMPALPDTNQMKDVLTSMRETLETLGVTFDNLDNAGKRVAGLGADFDHSAQIASLKRHMLSGDSKHQQKIDEIKCRTYVLSPVGNKSNIYCAVLLKDSLKDDVVPYVNAVISNDIDRQLEDMIQSLVAEEIARQIPQSLRDQIMDHKRHLEEVHVNLQNAEARRANALLRSTHLKDPLHPLLKANGEVSAKFPRDLTALFALDAAEAKALSSEYGLPDIGDSRERNLNRFMQFCGVSYQMTPAGYFQRGISQTKLTGIARGDRRVRVNDVRHPFEVVDVSGSYELPNEATATLYLRKKRDSFGLYFLAAMIAVASHVATIYLASAFYA
ncbi:hypothetical protein FRC04_007579 [Tulasnella sp. 424]|nr:hypothetical protein FRC04_007579 [Tulasnella sp. 424]KAG8979014.1 hypothetical protein FRC05_009224 [Tulasnella sp. 425]